MELRDKTVGLNDSQSSQDQCNRPIGYHVMQRPPF